MTRGVVRRGPALLIVCFFMLVGCNQARPLVPATEPGSIVGEAQMRRGGTQVWTRPSPDTILYVGDSVRALEITQIAFIDGTSLSLGKDVNLEIKAYDPRTKKLDLLTAIASFEVQDAQASIDISEDAALVLVENGQVRVTSGAKSQPVSGGQALRLAAGIFERFEIAADLPDPSVAATASATHTLVVAQAIDAARPVTLAPPETLSATPTSTPSPTRTAPPKRTATRTATPTQPKITQAVVAIPRIESPASPTVTATITPLPTETPIPSTATPEAPRPTSTPRPILIIRVNCGGSEYRDTQGHTWSADREYMEKSWGYTGEQGTTPAAMQSPIPVTMCYIRVRDGETFSTFLTFPTDATG